MSSHLEFKETWLKRSKKVRKCLTGEASEIRKTLDLIKANVSRTLQLQVLITVELLELAVND